MDDRRKLLSSGRSLRANVITASILAFYIVAVIATILAMAGATIRIGLYLQSEFSGYLTATTWNSPIDATIGVVLLTIALTLGSVALFVVAAMLRILFDLLFRGPVDLPFGRFWVGAGGLMGAAVLSLVWVLPIWGSVLPGAADMLVGLQPDETARNTLSMAASLVPLATISVVYLNDSAVAGGEYGSGSGRLSAGSRVNGSGGGSTGTASVSVGALEGNVITASLLIFYIVFVIATVLAMVMGTIRIGLYLQSEFWGHLTATTWNSLINAIIGVALLAITVIMGSIALFVVAKMLQVLFDVLLRGPLDLPLGYFWVGVGGLVGTALLSLVWALPIWRSVLPGAADMLVGLQPDETARNTLSMAASLVPLAAMSIWYLDDSAAAGGEYGSESGRLSVASSGNGSGRGSTGTVSDNGQFLVGNVITASLLIFYTTAVTATVLAMAEATTRIGLSLQSEFWGYLTATTWSSPIDATIGVVLLTISLILWSIVLSVVAEILRILFDTLLRGRLDLPLGYFWVGAGGLMGTAVLGLVWALPVWGSILPGTADMLVGLQPDETARSTLSMAASLVPLATISVVYLNDSAVAGGEYGSDSGRLSTGPSANGSDGDSTGTVSDSGQPTTTTSQTDENESTEIPGENNTPGDTPSQQKGKLSSDPKSFPWLDYPQKGRRVPCPACEQYVYNEQTAFFDHWKNNGNCSGPKVVDAKEWERLGVREQVSNMNIGDSFTNNTTRGDDTRVYTADEKSPGFSSDTNDTITRVYDESEEDQRSSSTVDRCPGCGDQLTGGDFDSYCPNCGIELI